MNEKIKSGRCKFMSLNSMKKLEEKLEKKKSKLKTLENRKSEIEEKIKNIQKQIEDLESSQFEQLKKSAKKENIEIRASDIPEILKLIKELQKSSNNEQSYTAKTEITKTPAKSPQRKEESKTQENRIMGLPTLDDLKGIPR